jgi:hypothetical protein
MTLVPASAQDFGVPGKRGEMRRRVPVLTVASYDHMQVAARGTPAQRRISHDQEGWYYCSMEAK